MDEDTNPSGVSGDAAAESALAKLFGDEPKPEPEDEGVEDQPDEPEADEAEQETTDEEPAEPEEVLEEVEVEGKTFKVPPEIKKGVMFQADYTQKTQSLAQQRRQIEERAQFLEQQEQAREVVFKKAVEVDRLEQQMAQFDAVDWIALTDSDPQEAMKLSVKREALRTQHANAMGQLRTAYHEAQQKTASERQQTLKRTLDAVKEAIPGFNEAINLELDRHVSTYGAGQMERDAFLRSPMLVQMAYESLQWKKLQAAKPAVTKKAAEAKPMVKTTSRGIQQTQAAAKTKESFERLRKTGKTADAEEAFTRLFESRRKR